jgi:hypothetical protein
MSDNSVGSVNRSEEAPAMPRGADLPPSEIVALLDKIQLLLDEQQPQHALDLIRRSKARSPWITNASAVCHMREGNLAIAIQSLRTLVLSGLFIRPDLPVPFKTNYATALLASGDLNGCLNVLAEINHEDEPAVQRLRSAIRAWKSRLSLWQKLWWSVGGDVHRPVEIDFPLGNLR